MEGTGKLVRDRIPELIAASGGQPQTRVARGEEYLALLRLKLLEEVQEFLDSDDAGELVDVIEVVYALARHKGVEPESLEELREVKERERGGFGARTVLITAPEQDNLAEPDPVTEPAEAPGPPIAASRPPVASVPPAAPAPPSPSSLFFKAGTSTSGTTRTSSPLGTVYRSGSVVPGHGSSEVPGGTS